MSQWPESNTHYLYAIQRHIECAQIGQNKKRGGVILLRFLCIYTEQLFGMVFTVSGTQDVKLLVLMASSGVVKLEISLQHY